MREATMIMMNVKASTYDAACELERSIDAHVILKTTPDHDELVRLYKLAEEIRFELNSPGFNE